MGSPAASSTAVLVCQGRAVADGRLGVGRFSDPVSARLLDPGEREVVDRVRGRGEGETSGPAAPLAEQLVARAAVTVVPRSVAVDDAVRDHAAAQVVLLGAGLDARAWRMPELAGATVFEVDHPASQADKRRRVRGLTPTAGRVAFVAADLATDRLHEALAPAGFDEAVPSTWVWEGVVPYLTREAVVETLLQVAVLSAPGSRLVVQYQARSATARTMRAVARLAFTLSRTPDPLAHEPWRTLVSPEQLATWMRTCGYRVRRDHSLLELADGLDLPSGGTASLRNGRVAVAVRR